MYRVFFECTMKVASEKKANYCWPVTVPPPGEIDHTTGEYVPNAPLRIVCGFFKVQESLYVQGLWDGAYGLS